MKSLTKEKRYDLIDAFNSTSCAQWRILKPPGSLLATDRSKAVVLV